MNNFKDFLGRLIEEQLEPLKTQIRMRLNSDISYIEENVEGVSDDELFDFVKSKMDDAIDSYLDLFCTTIFSKALRFVEDIDDSGDDSNDDDSNDDSMVNHN